MKRTKGIQPSTTKMFVWGQPGHFKSTFVSKVLDSPVFIDPSGGTSWLDVERVSVADWPQFKAAIAELRADKGVKSIVVDELEVVQQMCHDWCLKSLGIGELGQLSHGRGWGKFRDELHSGTVKELVAMQALGKNWGVIAHSEVVRFDNPEGNAYDKYQPKVDKSIYGPIKGLADAVLFFAQKASVRENNEGATVGTLGKKSIYTSGGALFDAKNRWGLPERIDNDETAPLFVLDAIKKFASGQQETK